MPGGYTKLVDGGGREPGHHHYHATTDTHDTWHGRNGQGAGVTVYLAPGADDYSDNDLEMVEYSRGNERDLLLSNRKKRRDRGGGDGGGEEKTQYIERDIEAGDSLGGLALQYRCSVSELKRINKLIQDVDFYALKRIKIPVKPFSALSELLDPPPDDASLPPKVRCNSLGDLSSRDDGGSCDGGLIRTVSIGDLYGHGNGNSTHSKPGSPRSFLRQMDQDLERMRERSECLAGLGQAQPPPTTQTMMFYPLSHTTQQHQTPSRYDGASCGISWFGALMLVLFVGLLLPVTFYLYYEYHFRHKDQKL